MFIRSFLIISFLMLGGGSSVAKASEILHALDECPEDIPACMEMDLNMVWPPDWTDKRYAQLHPSAAIESRGVTINARDGSEFNYVTYRISVSGRLNGGELQSYDLLFTTGGEMYCTDFMDGAVATIGFNASGEGVILTREGTLELMNSPLKLGCEDCVALVDKESLEISHMVSPSWYGRGPMVHSDGRIFWKNGKRCLRMPSDERFTPGNAEDCVAPTLERASPELVEAVRGQKVLPENRLEYDLHEIPDSDFLVFIYGVACT